MSGLGVISYDLDRAKPPFIQQLISNPRGDLNLDVSGIPATLSHPWYDSARNKYILPAGTLLAKITSTGFLIPVKRTLQAGATVIGAVATIVDDAENFVVGDIVTIDAEAITITAINYTTNTFSHVATTANHADNSEVFVNNVTGVKTAVGILYNDVEYNPTSNDITCALIDRADIVEAALPQGVTPTMKTDLTARINFI